MVTADPIASFGFEQVSTLRPLPAGGAATAPTHTAPSALAPRTAPTLERRRMWERRYVRRLRASDVLVVLTATAAAGWADAVAHQGTVESAPEFVRAPLLAAAVWVAMLALFHTRTIDIVGSGSVEYLRVAHATGLAFGILAMLFVVVQWPGVRIQLIVALPLGLLGLLIGRWEWRRWLTRQRRRGRCTSRAIVAGTRDDAGYVIRGLERARMLGYDVIGVATTDTAAAGLVVDDHVYPRTGAASDVAEQARLLSVDTIIVASRPEDDPDFIQHLSWELEGTAAELILSSRLADVAGPRISLHPVDGLPLIHVKIPEFEGGQHLLKRALDIVVAGVALLPLALITPVIALLIVIDSNGPVFFTQTRIGRDGREFRMLKFRTMRPNAESELAALAAKNEGAGLLFKVKDDPRVTRVGAILRRYSLDELPQFWNVLRGDMSVVGPRPPLPSEVTGYDGRVTRRLYIKPGITGLWQVSGRSDLSWDESVRLDLHYVENWSVMTDLMIMWRTAKVMFEAKGAY